MLRIDTEELKKILGKHDVFAKHRASFEEEFTKFEFKKILINNSYINASFVGTKRTFRVDNIYYTLPRTEEGLIGTKTFKSTLNPKVSKHEVYDYYLDYLISTVDEREKYIRSCVMVDFVYKLCEENKSWSLDRDELWSYVSELIVPDDVHERFISAFTAFVETYEAQKDAIEAKIDSTARKTAKRGAIKKARNAIAKALEFGLSEEELRGILNEEVVNCVMKT